MIARTARFTFRLVRGRARHRRAGLATATAKRVVAGSRNIEVAHVRITEVGRKALAETR
jgi:hypothetical protein